MTDTIISTPKEARAALRVLARTSRKAQDDYDDARAAGLEADETEALFERWRAAVKEHCAAASVIRRSAGAFNAPSEAELQAARSVIEDLRSASQAQ